MRIKDDNGHWHEDQIQIMPAVYSHFEKVYQSEGTEGMMECIAKIPKVITDAQNGRLMATVSNEEIKVVVFSMGSLKAPGPDGLNGLFYQKNWDLINSQCAML